MLRDTSHAMPRDGRRLAAPHSECPPGSGRGVTERFFNHTAREMPAADVDDGHAVVRVIAAGPNAFIYFTDRPEPLLAEEIERRHPDLVARLSRHPGIGFALVRSAEGPECWWRGRRVSLDDGSSEGPFASRADKGLVLTGLRELMAMPSAGDIVLYGIGAPGGDVSFIPERGAHAGPSEAEMHTFILHPGDVPLPDEPITHPVQLYPHFAAYTADPEHAVADRRPHPVQVAAPL